MKRLMIILPLSLLLFSACSEKHEDKKATLVSKVATVSDISVSKDEHAFESKVKSAEQPKDGSYYYSYNKPIQKPHEVRTNLKANMNVRSPYEDVRISMIVKKLSKQYIIKCSPCHNDYANGLIGPSLLHKDADFIYETIMKYKSGEKTNVLMVSMVKRMDNTEIKKLSKEIQLFNKQIAKLHAGE